jgi:hypothetical protein
MAEIIPLTPRFAQYRSLLVPPIDVYSALVPLDALPALEREIEATLKPAHPHEVSMAVAALGRWSNVGPGIQDPEQYSQGMEEALTARGYPVDVLQEAVVEARATFDWYPSPRAMLAICERLIEPRRKKRQAIWQMQAEHARRQQEAAERKAQAEREAERAARIRWLQGLEERARERFGNDAPLPGEIEFRKPRWRTCGTCSTSGARKSRRLVRALSPRPALSVWSTMRRAAIKGADHRSPRHDNGELQFLSRCGPEQRRFERRHIVRSR